MTFRIRADDMLGPKFSYSINKMAEKKHIKDYHFFVLFDVQGSFDDEVLFFLRIGVLYFTLREGF